MADADTARQVLRQHILVGEWTLSQLGVKKNMYTLQGVPAVIQTKYKSRVSCLPCICFEEDHNHCFRVTTYKW